MIVCPGIYLAPIHYPWQFPKFLPNTSLPNELEYFLEHLLDHPSSNLLEIQMGIKSKSLGNKSGKKKREFINMKWT